MRHAARSLAPFAPLESDTFKGQAGSDLSRSHVSRHVMPHEAVRTHGVQRRAGIEDPKRAGTTSEQMLSIKTHCRLLLVPVSMTTLRLVPSIHPLSRPAWSFSWSFSQQSPGDGSVTLSDEVTLEVSPAVVHVVVVDLF